MNTTVEEALNLAYHGARAEMPGFNITMEKDLDPKAGSIDAFPQEFLRVMLNLLSNGFYAARKRGNAIKDKSFEPTLRVTTRNLGSQVVIGVRDNGTGIGDEVRQDFQTILHHQAGRGRHRARPVAQLRHHREAAWGATDRGQPAKRIYRVPNHPASQDGCERGGGA